MALSANKQKEKEILECVKSESKKHNWKLRGFQMFKIEESFLFSVNFFVNGKNNSLNGSLNFKPIDIDNLHRKITGEEDYFKNGPLFYKVNSWGMIFPYTYFNFDIKEIEDDKTEKLLNEINKKVSEILQKYSDKDRYYEFVKEQKEIMRVCVQQVYLTNLAYLKKYDELLDYINYCKENNIDSGLTHINSENQKLSWDYYDKLIEYINKQLNANN